MAQCRLCPRRCGTRRLDGETGKCRTADKVIIYGYGPHFGEEAPLVGRGGSGTIFFTHCNLACIYCQNYTISQLGVGKPAEPREIAGMMLDLQDQGCHNINLVSPTHVVPFILEALLIAAEKGLTLPLVYNTGSYDVVETLRLLDGIVDIYMPDMKYSDAETALQLSGVQDYPSVNRDAVREMHRQVGDLTVNDDIAERGLLVRHLVLPDGLAGTEETVQFLAREISVSTYLNIMAQYHPVFHATTNASLSRRITVEEYSTAVNLAHRYGLNRLDGGYFGS